MFTQMKIELDNDYSITAIKEDKDISISIHHEQLVVGEARITTDNVDVECITSISIDNDHINKILHQKYTLGEIFIKFLMKFPTMVRKPEFRFILNVPDNLKLAFEKHHFNGQSGSNNEIMVRNQIILPNHNKMHDEVIFKSTIGSDKYPDLLSFLQKNAYWQPHLTSERLNLLISNSNCFFVTSKSEEIIGFTRVLTDNVTFASLWDVVIDEAYRKQGIGTALMLKIFTDDTLCKIPNWVLFTDTAKKFYERFGFVSEAEIPNRKIIHKLRLQDKHPDYMKELIQAANNGLPVCLNEKQSMAFLFENKRAQLYSFWKNVSGGNEPILHLEQLSEMFVEHKRF